MATYHVEMRAYRLVGLAGLVFCFFSALAATIFGQYWTALGFAGFAIIGLYIVLGSGSFDFDSDCITHSSWFGKWKIRWDEIDLAEFGEMDGTLVLIGNNKRFVLSPPGWWYGSGKDEALRFVMSQIEAKKLKPQPSRTAAYKTMKNTRVQ